MNSEAIPSTHGPPLMWLPNGIRSVAARERWRAASSANACGVTGSRSPVTIKVGTPDETGEATAAAGRARHARQNPIAWRTRRDPRNVPSVSRATSDSRMKGTSSAQMTESCMPKKIWSVIAFPNAAASSAKGSKSPRDARSRKNGIRLDRSVENRRRWSREANRSAVSVPVSCLPVAGFVTRTDAGFVSSDRRIPRSFPPGSG